ncbi:STAS domain-containing protein [Streptomyces sp. RB6PN25]|uniref:STAS domain-containing protein n=1 Tax=Streptomyces humicola TaxID=2953240 RepID=A0ABT1Q540_9ACTN|nr:STAS domain-containing protein [Streptomyces humicola]MCQ4085039.1 STAS domain-containing protein [Streptomyces humicola]
MAEQSTDGIMTAPCLELSTSRIDGWSLAEVAGELDLATCPQLQEFVGVVLADHGGPTRAIVDLAGVTFCDVHGLSTLASINGRARRQGYQVRFVCPEGPVRRLFRLLGDTHALPLYDTTGDALAAGDEQP